ncbi:hypothetical protein EJF18_80180 [Clavispora lusitaniae]|uniref:Uncharacterized protein n=1 Tax=Clavispora lusitaniae TaxID=36911 RepID=A0ACD0WST0_CLALS|nr:hypothetical protein EJF14_80180 [Clavispora lusitaniae]QFZ36123.1 hypothetical protein EJF16_80180 [Clavispora lusitaniae]QFZ41807.1 hypothetical protein EJF15_80180 [Clavispora lusitaniae]QFZ47483.1 hypothetical protein EJF18_80180 [Clavispora lusitaniae]QFZ53162.1 hypothetical protein EJF17_80180 [Clavispora lusitaniae]
MKTVPDYEKPIHTAVVQLYDTLQELKNNRSKFLSSKQVYSIYEQFLEQVHELSIVRKDEELKGLTLSLPTPTDQVIDDCWQLLSLSFVTCGLTKFAPATYSSLSTVYKLLTHLKECQVFSIDDLRPIKQRLDEIRDIISHSENIDEGSMDAENGAADHHAEESLLLRTKLHRCQQAYDELEETFRRMPSDLEPVYTQLISLRKSLLNCVTLQSDSGKAPDVEPLRASLRRIEAQRDENGRFRSSGDAELVERAQMVLNGLLDDCNNLLQDAGLDMLAAFSDLSVDMSDKESATFAGLRSVYEELIALKQTLEKLLVTRRWTMRETDLYGYQKQLKRLDEQRVSLTQDSASSGAAGRKMRRVSLLVLYLLRRCYSLVYKLLESSEPVSESLQPIHNQLSTVRRCLLEIKRVDGLSNLRQLYPFQFKLASLDNLRHDGKFIVNNQVPEGQATLNALLAECFDIMHELKIELEEKEESEQTANITDDEDKDSDDEVELKRNRYMGFNEADYDMASESDDEFSSLSDSEFESNDYY